MYSYTTRLMSICTLVGLLVAFLFATPISSGMAIGWESHDIDEKGAEDLCLRIDDAGDLHATYLDGDSKYLMLANDASGTWVKEVTPASGYSSTTGSMALDANGHVHICYYDYYNRAIGYITNESGVWKLDTLDIGHCGYATAIAVDSLGKVHIIYQYSSSSSFDLGLGYATNKGGNWTYEKLDKGNNLASTVSMTIDPKDNIHVAYRGGAILKYICYNGTAWQTPETLLSAYDVAKYCSLAVDSNGKVHIAFSIKPVLNPRDDSFSLRYIDNTAGAWAISYVDNYTDAHGISLTVDSLNRNHISYVDPKTKELIYTTDMSGKWTHTVLESGIRGERTSMVIDKDGHLYIAYSMAEKSGLRYLTNNISDPEDPEISILTPTSDTNFDTNRTSITLTGTARDNIGVTSVTWSNSLGGSGVAIMNGEDWVISSMSLEEGDNVITVTAYDANNNTQVDTIVVNYEKESLPGNGVDGVMLFLAMVTGVLVIIFAVYYLYKRK